jgi:hypothetical protein
LNDCPNDIDVGDGTEAVGGMSGDFTFIVNVSPG